MSYSSSCSLLPTDITIINNKPSLGQVRECQVGLKVKKNIQPGETEDFKHCGRLGLSLDFYFSLLCDKVLRWQFGSIFQILTD